MATRRRECAACASSHTVSWHPRLHLRRIWTALTQTAALILTTTATAAHHSHWMAIAPTGAMHSLSRTARRQKAAQPQ